MHEPVSCPPDFHPDMVILSATESPALPHAHGHTGSVKLDACVQGAVRILASVGRGGKIGDTTEIQVLSNNSSH